MSNEFWQIDKQLRQLGIGKTTTERVKAYVMMWEKRCYCDGIPDRLPELLEATNRAPSWHKIAICLLKNDLKLRRLGFTEEKYNHNLIAALKKKVATTASVQGDFWGAA